jgi:hypothetical protein
MVGISRRAVPILRVLRVIYISVANAAAVDKIAEIPAVAEQGNFGP